MLILLVLCHPERGSLNHAIAARLRDRLEAEGHQVRFHDLYHERFDPVLRASELRRGFSLEEDVQRYDGELEDSDGLVVVHPEWWGGPPAMLKGWVDRVFRPGLAYEFGGAEFLTKRKTGLLSEKRALVFATTNVSQADSSGAVELFWLRAVFGYCGLERAAVRVLFDARACSNAERTDWIDDAEALAATWFADEAHEPGPA